MRLHRLSVQAFGPFAGRESVDFDALSAGGLFLLHGPTGAGKTSVLDAVCFALYGTVPGRRPKDRLRSDHAEPGVHTEVELDLTVGGRRLRLIRSPEYERPKLRGEGTTLQRARSFLSEWDAEASKWRARSTSHQEIAEEVEGLLGMRVDQFCQVVLLPQGDFARFLQSGAQEREKLLGRLFGTGRFGRAEDWLDDRRRAADRACAEVGARIDAVVQRLAEASGARAPEGGEDAPEPLVWSAWLREAAREAQACAVSAEKLSAGRRTAARAALDAAERLAEQQQTYRQALERRERLAAAEPRRAEIADRLAAAARADSVAPLLQAADRAAAEAERARSGYAALRPRRVGAAAGAAGVTASAASPSGGGGPAAPFAEGGGAADGSRAGGADRRAGAAGGLVPAQPEGPRNDAGRGPGPLGPDLVPDLVPDLTPDLAPDLAPEIDALRSAEREAREELGRVRGLLGEEQRLLRLGAEREKLTAEAAEAEALRADAHAWLETAPEQRSLLLAREAAARQASGHAERLAEQLTAAQGRLAAAHERDALNARLAPAEERLRTLRDAELRARERWLDLRERRLAGMAAELAQQLADGRPCPVCGSPAHPAPAETGPSPVTKADEEAAQDAQRAAEAAVAQAESALRATREAAAAARARAGDESADHLAGRVRELTRERAESARAAADAVAAAEALDRHDREQREFTATREDAAARTAACLARLESLAEEEAALADRLAGARGGAPSVAVRAERLAVEAAALARALEAAQSARTAAAEAARSARAAEAEAAAQGFADADEAARTILPRGEREALAEELAEHRSRTAATAELLADPGLRAAADAPAAEPEAARRALARAEEAARRAYAAAEAARGRVRALDRLHHELSALAREFAPLDERRQVVRGLAELARGTAAENRLKMPLETYVLAARLEQVAAAAGARLERMSGGRYTLAYSDRRAKGGGRSGLGLVVLDAWTGLERDTATLSGGEGFFASLALALGLADVVTDEAGGRPLDTLFVDEGFGTLDEETLEDVLDVLDSLRERDRAVGVISHVAELRRRVPVRLSVRKGREGSRLTLHAGRDS
ncbi:AAA family ATPase [Phaeacidiphilus oryzae]|uniref:AAA family ATPase n=1 Tax=Phaeacidiphilus oryzae TaxID=348818 RepID=UPI00056C2D0E|nr:SMC family ATPase [Phaeacidiphilus oryzae]